MTYLIDPASVLSLSARIAKPIPDAQLRARFADLLAQAFFADPACARLATPEECARAAQTGACHAFDPPRIIVNRARRDARAVRDALQELADLRAKPAPLKAREILSARFAEEFRRKASRMSYAALIEKAKYLVAERRTRLKTERDETPLFPPSYVAATMRREWRRVISVAELRKVGADLHNCLGGRSGHHRTYARRLSEDSARFWALYEPDGKACAAVMADSNNGRVLEARIVRNAPLDRKDPDYIALLETGLCKPPPIYVSLPSRPSPDSPAGRDQIRQICRELALQGIIRVASD